MPVTKILLHEVWEVEKEKFSEIIGRRIGSGSHPDVYWAAGAAFIITEFPPTDRIVRDRLEGVMHVKTAVFTRMDYEPEINTIMQGRVGVLDVRQRRVLADLATYLTQYYQVDPNMPVEVAETSRYGS